MIAPHRRSRAAVASAVAGLAGLAWFAANGGGPALNPRNVAWLLAGGDPTQHWLGWCFFRISPWALPLGTMPGYGFPLGTSVALTDAIPLVSVALRPFAPLLPTDFQFLGPWLALCFVLQGVFGARLTSVVDARPTVQALGGILFVLSPILLRRIGHEALCAQWILLAVLGLGLRPVVAGERRRAAVAVGSLDMLAASIHPFLAAMALALSLGAVLRWRREDPTLGRREAVVMLGAWVSASVAVLATFGYFSGTPLGAHGFGYFSADLLSLVNPMGWSRVLPTYATGPGQYEGFGFVGAGTLLLAVVSVIVLVARRERFVRSAARWAGPVLVVTVVLWALATTTQVSFAGHRFIRLTPPGPIYALLSPFRSSGRFIWPLQALAVLAAVAAAVQAFRGRGAVAVLAAAVCLQAADLGTERMSSSFVARSRVPDLSAWDMARGRVHHLAVVPQRIRDADGRGCVAGGTLGEDPRLAYVAYRLGLTFNSGYFSRISVEAAQRTCAAHDEAVACGNLDPDTLYILAPSAERKLPAGRAVCGRIDEYLACVSVEQASLLKDGLSQHASAPANARAH